MKWPQGCVHLRGLSTTPAVWEWETACGCLSAAVHGEEGVIWCLLFSLLSLVERLWICVPKLGIYGWGKGDHLPRGIHVML